MRACAEIVAHDAGGAIVGAGAKDQLVAAAGVHRPEFAERHVDIVEPARCEIDQGEPPDAVLDVARDQAIRCDERVGRHPEHPLGVRELGVLGDDLPGGFARDVMGVEIPPAGAIRVEDQQRTVRRPFGLHDRLRRAAGDCARRTRRAAGRVELGDIDRKSVV